MNTKKEQIGFVAVFCTVAAVLPIMIWCAIQVLPERPSETGAKMSSTAEQKKSPSNVVSIRTQSGWKSE